MTVNFLKKISCKNSLVFVVQKAQLCVKIMLLKTSRSHLYRKGNFRFHKFLFSMLIIRAARGFGSPGAKAKAEANCERSEQKFIAATTLRLV